MRFLSRTFLGLAIVTLLTSAADAFQLTGQLQTDPQTTVQCGPLPDEIVLKRVLPKYPLEAITAGIEGTVEIRVLISKHGFPEKFQVTSGPPELVKASLEAVRQWRYMPYKLNGRAVAIEASITIHYSLPSKKLIASADKPRS